MDFNLKQNSHGFSLLEVMIVLVLFSTFLIVFHSSMGYNRNDSALLQEDLKLHGLASDLINQMILDPPPFGNSLKETKNFEEKENSNYSYTVEMERLELPDLAKLVPDGNSGEEDSEDGGQMAADMSALQKMVLEKVKTNVEKIIWQIRITVTNKENEYSYSLSTWIINPDEKVELDLNF